MVNGRLQTENLVGGGAAKYVGGVLGAFGLVGVPVVMATKSFGGQFNEAADISEGLGWGAAVIAVIIAIALYNGRRGSNSSTPQVAPDAY